MRLLAAAAALLLGAPALAQAAPPIEDPLELGVLRNEEIRVVQNRMYPKDGRAEIGVALGFIPFDAYTVAPLGRLTYGQHMSETFGWEIQLAGGYGIPNGHYNQLNGPEYGVQPEAYRYLAGVTGGVEFSPVYAKMAWGTGRVMHYDVYFPVVAGVTIEQLVEVDLAGDASPFAIGPTIGAGVGARVFLRSSAHLRIELRDDVMFQSRASGTSAIKQNVGVTVGLGWLRGS